MSYERLWYMVGRFEVDEQVAEQTYSSNATVIRLCRKLGYKGFREFKVASIRYWLRKTQKKEISVRILQKMIVHCL